MMLLASWVGMKNLATFVAQCDLQLQKFELGMTLMVGSVCGFRLALTMFIVILTFLMRCLSMVMLLQVNVFITVVGRLVVDLMMSIFRVDLFWDGPIMIGTFRFCMSVRSILVVLSLWKAVRGRVMDLGIVILVWCIRVSVIGPLKVSWYVCVWEFIQVRLRYLIMLCIVLLLLVVLRRSGMM